MLKKNLTLGVTGSIAAYKIPALIRKLRSENFETQVIITQNAKRFVAPLSLATVSGKPVLENQFDYTMPHLHLEKNTDLFVLCPLSANTMGKIANGLADDLLSSTILATRTPVLMIPAMNTGMWENKIVDKNIQKLLQLRNFHLLDPDAGELACSVIGKGRMPDFNTIVLEINKILSKQSLRGKKVLITTGPTREYIDPARYISNGSSGKMGLVLAEEAYSRGAEVILIAGPIDLNIPRQIKTIKVVSTMEMYQAVMDHLAWLDIFISAAAVADFKTKEQSSHKVKKEQGIKNLKLVKTMDILKEVGLKKGQKKVVGFALESEDLVENAKQKLQDKNLDLIIGNSLSSIGSEQLEGVIINAEGQISDFQILNKKDWARRIFDWVIR
jgi:phosphopantothenoylcysteine decarboxylase/phosphopantothenate--cysteine ligase